MTEKDRLLGEVEAFLHEFGMLPTVFGKQSTGDPAFVGRLRVVRKTVTVETAGKVRRYMSAYRESHGRRKPPRPTGSAGRAKSKAA